MITSFISKAINILHLLFGGFAEMLVSKLNVLRSVWKCSTLKHVGKKTRLGVGVELIGSRNISLGECVHIGRYTSIAAWTKHGNQTYAPEITIGSGSSIGAFAHISAIDRIAIGSNVLMGKYVTIVDNYHGKSSAGDIRVQPSKRELFSKGPVVIENNVWIADKVSIMSGVTIGSGAVIGSNSVVTKDVPCNSVVGGVPAKILRSI